MTDTYILYNKVLFLRWRYMEARDDGERVRGPHGRMISGFQSPPLTSFSIVAPPNNIPYNYAFSKVNIEHLMKKKECSEMPFKIENILYALKGYRYQILVCLFSLERYVVRNRAR
jgi:hypothetical protein